MDLKTPLADYRPELKANSFRRITATFALSALGVVLLSVVMRSPPTHYLTVLFSFGGVAALGGAWALWRATASAVVLTSSGLEDADGTLIAPLEQIREVNSGFVALGPSNGFVVRLDRPLPARWRPGLWWRLGTRVGVGGITARAPDKFLADQLRAAVQER